ncbi:hypothetical protein CBS63078_4623 [Aspergillus niger]|uniref:Contig An02c0270, genomic contig n=6 Tax=Aspergillus TaxID=5052 RepID=A2QDY0_ASPNC|nr:uncharacterized protein An02g08680 [Aspergillus niger]XP_025448830.1 uncharacterized protein BO96DRAFT_451193 [Aspergillus niger CBS 101883]EHA23181.1 hypothetical protein ASPNIDRAFT_52342 [Aspergillus niger ATCC 1015]RDH19965.1 hypothetical protein M747DRAFT_44561 [Aspergillus niger ATCC 13496]RDK43874.1 hypothetical protein M752DRAFT_146465 [Aspergillus phoenicis ATCC 13157]KAI2821423.1 hypothetical protein CBS115989_2901 [Aspergillus niger]KAI2824428.1 hypothetical protein CBS133816_884|eukprot:XP_001400001.1 hypothetical protein ANI_1_1244024 [Aspergillus niger CBS 513.88]
MCPMLLNGLSDGPAMVLSPPQDHAFVQFPRQSKFTHGTESRPFFSNNNNPFQPSKPSRKRSRDEDSFEEAMNGSNTPMSIVTASAPQPGKQEVEEPIYGEGMVLLNPRTKMAISAESQTGTWYEETVENVSTAAPVSSRRSGSPSSASRKAQRLDPAASSFDDITLSSIQRKMNTDQQDDNRRILNAGNRSEEPTVDDATRLLGISWQRIATDDADMAAAVRGWKKYIDRQFATYLADSQILLKNRALNAYLVTARPMTPMGVAPTPAFYLFNDDLTQAQLVGSTWEACLMNLRSSPIVFEGTQILNAADRPLNNGMTSMGAQNLLGANPVDSGLPLLQTLCAQPVNHGNGLGLNNGVGMGTGMEIDA